eukprot:jgi/Psemu1/11476/gm1.11476_g
MLALLSAEGHQLLLSQRTTTNLENRSRKCEEEIDGCIYAIDLLLGMEEFLKYAGTFDEVFKQDKKGVLNLDKWLLSKGEGNNLDSAASKSNHKTEVKAPAKRTQQIKSTLIKQTCNTLQGFTEQKRYDNCHGTKSLFWAHPSFKSDSGQVSNVWYDWENSQLDLLNGHGLQVYPCQILCLLHLKGPFSPGSSVSGFELVHHNGYYVIAHCFVSVDPIWSKREKWEKHRHVWI